MKKAILAISVVVAAGAFLVWVAKLPTEEEKAGAEIERWATVKRDEKASGKPVVSAEFRGKLNMGDSDLKPLDMLPNLRSPSIFGIDITDVGVGHIKGLSELQELSLCNTSVTNDGLKNLEGLRRLRKLGIGASWFTDDALTHVKMLPNLQELDLSGDKITDGGLEHLKGLTQLRILNLMSTQVTDKGVNALQRALPNCEIKR